jgi:hypothetical protein
MVIAAVAGLVLLLAFFFYDDLRFWLAASKLPIKPSRADFSVKVGYVVFSLPLVWIAAVALSIFGLGILLPVLSPASGGEARGLQAWGILGSGFLLGTVLTAGFAVFSLTRRSPATPEAGDASFNAADMLLMLIGVAYSTIGFRVYSAWINSFPGYPSLLLPPLAVLLAWFRERSRRGLNLRTVLVYLGLLSCCMMALNAVLGLLIRLVVGALRLH